ncbi:MAG: hypothetical protein AAGH92_09510 [Planctomycetota bacterium]
MSTGKPTRPEIELRSERIVMTLDLLIERIGLRLPGRGLVDVAMELRAATAHAISETQALAKPSVWLRLAVAVLLITMCIVLVKIGMTYLRFDQQADGFSMLEGIDAAISTVVYLGLMVLFLLTVEGRLKRRRALRAIQELRVLAHVIDMHQLSKDPERLLDKDVLTFEDGTPAVDRLTPYQMARYLDFCSEMLSLLSKVSVLYLQDLQDEVVLRAVDEIERLSTGLSQKIWQKIMILDQIIATGSAQSLGLQSPGRIITPGDDQPAGQV